MNAFELCGMAVSNFRVPDIKMLDNVERGLFVQSTFCYLEIACMLELHPRLCENLQRFTTGSDSDDLALLTMLTEGKYSFDDFVLEHGLRIEFEQETKPVEETKPCDDNECDDDYPSDYDSEEEREDRREYLQEKKEEQNRRKYTTTILSNGRW